MITLNQEHRLGHKAFYLLLGRRTALGFVIFIVAIVLYMIRSVLLYGASQFVMSASSAPVPAAANLPFYIQNGVNGIFLFSILLIIFGLLVAWLEYRNYSFRFDEFDLHMRQGILSRKEVAIPYRSMQDINIFRSLVYQMLGVSRLIIDSAGHEEKDANNQTDIILEPLDSKEAEDIRDFLERRIGVQVVVDQKVADAENEMAKGPNAGSSTAA